jgi:chemotaxis family two-component system response regulator Rcp1
MNIKREIDILLVEDDPGDVELTKEGLQAAKMYVHLHVVDDGIKALQHLRKQGAYADAVRPDLVLLDLNLPKKDGREVLREIKADEGLKSIPVVVLTTSDADKDIATCYSAGANCYITKPVGFEGFIKVVSTLEEFWFTIVRLPKGV